MTGVVVVAPREITDLAYRACRVAHCGAGLADLVAADVTHCEIHRGDGLAQLIDLLDADPCPLRALAVRAMAGDTTVPFVLRCRSTDLPVRGERDRSSHLSPEGTRDVLALALAVGVTVSSDEWTRLERHAAPFLLAERVIDDANETAEAGAGEGAGDGH